MFAFQPENAGLTGPQSRQVAFQESLQGSPPDLLGGLPQERIARSCARRDVARVAPPGPPRRLQRAGQEANRLVRRQRSVRPDQLLVDIVQHRVDPGSDLPRVELVVLAHLVHLPYPQDVAEEVMLRTGTEYLQSRG